MKKASFTGLLYRELYLLKKDYLTNLMIFFLFAALGWLIFLSMKYGNLGYFIGGYSEGSRHLLVSKDTSEALCVSAVLYLKLMPCLFPREPRGWWNQNT